MKSLRAILLSRLPLKLLRAIEYGEIGFVLLLAAICAGFGLAARGTPLAPRQEDPSVLWFAGAGLLLLFALWQIFTLWLEGREEDEEGLPGPGTLF